MNMKRKCESILFVLILFLISIIGLLYFFEFPVSWYKYPAWALAVVLAGKIITELFIHDFHIKRDPHLREHLQDELLILECDVKDYNAYILTALLLWLGLIMVKTVSIPLLEPVLMIIEKLVVASLIVLSIFVFFSLIDIVTGPCNCTKVHIKGSHQKTH